MNTRLLVLAVAVAILPFAAAQGRLPEADAFLTCTGTQSSHGNRSDNQMSDQPVTFTVYLDHAGCPTLGGPGTPSFGFCDTTLKRTVKRERNSVKVNATRGEGPLSSYDQVFLLNYVDGKIGVGGGGHDVSNTLDGRCVLATRYTPR